MNDAMGADESPSGPRSLRWWSAACTYLGQDLSVHGDSRIGRAWRTGVAARWPGLWVFFRGRYLLADADSPALVLPFGRA